MRGKAISSGGMKIILNVFKHFKTENSSLNENAVITLTFNVAWIGKHGVKSPSKIRPTTKKEFNKLNVFKLGVVRRMITPVLCYGWKLADIYFFKAKISSKICKNCVEHVKHVKKPYWKIDRQ